MASYHCTVKVGAKGKAAPHSAYISREGKYSGSERYEDLEATNYGNMPGWAEHNPAHFWNAADEHERANGATYREIEVALPRELDAAQRRALVEDFIAQEVGDKHAYQWAIHTPDAALEKGEQPHAHIMYSERTVDAIKRDPEQYFKRYNAKTPEKGGCRKDSAGTEERLQATRQRWANVQNAHLERHGIEARVDHRSLKEQGIDREPEKHIGASRIMAMPEQDMAALLTRRTAEGELDRVQHEVSSVIDLTGDLKSAIADRDQQLKIKQGLENEQRINGSLERIGRNVKAAGRAGADAGRALLASKQSLIAATGHTRDIKRSAQGAIQGAERRVAERDYGRVVEAARRKFEVTGDLVQQVVRNIDHVVGPIAAAAQHIEIYTVERERQARQRAQAARQVAAATNLLPKHQSAPVVPPVRSAAAVLANAAQHFDQSNKSESKARVVEVPASTRLNADDAGLFHRTEKAIAVAQVSGSGKDIEALASRFREIDQVQSELTKAATPNGWDTRPFDERSAAQQLATRDLDRCHVAINAEAKAAGHTQLPFAVVQSTPTSSTFDRSQEAAAEALARHARSERPLGLFRRETKDTKEWDAQRAALETNKARCDKAIAWRDGREAMASIEDGVTFHKRLDDVRKEYAAKSDAAIAKCAPARERLRNFAQERKRLESLVEKILSPVKQRELSIEQQDLSIERSSGHGMGR